MRSAQNARRLGYSWQEWEDIIQGSVYEEMVPDVVGHIGYRVWQGRFF
jgi:hypothetical protein